jgi:DNA-binding transcriptional MerR regulator
VKRYYRSRQRTQAGYRLYRPETLDHLAFIKRAQALGFTLSEIRDLLGGCHDTEECQRVELLLEQKIVELDRKMQEIQSLRTVLSTYLVACQDALATGQAQAGRPVLSNIGAQYLPQQAT